MGKTKYFFRIALVLLILSPLLLVAPGFTNAEAFADQAFANIWQKTDQAIANGSLKASWIWGPEPRLNRYEAYKDSPGGQRLVSYFDKSRMEINNPNGDRNSIWFVTNGLLCRELVSGQMALGDYTTEAKAPAAVPVGGDLDSPYGPTYATFNSIASLNNDHRAGNKNGYVTDFIDRQGAISKNTVYPQRASYAFYENNLGHNIPDVFYNWMAGLKGRGIDWQYVIGLPITEPYWAKFKIAGVEREVLVQLFERRALTFNPANDPVWQVEMGNIGIHYMAWRNSVTPITTTPVAAPTTTPPKSTTPSTTPPTTAAPTPIPTNGLDTEEQAFLGTINQYRAANGKGALSVNQKLTAASRWMSGDMGAKNYFSHTDSLGRDPFKRMNDFGYTYHAAAENIAAGYETAQDVFTGWKNSPGHNTNMLGNYTEIGIGRVYTASSLYKWYWTTDFGTP
ncbi:MAG: CAP domain-containing protein [Chloroflexi bacterium]|uniref:CAP domain-containing protein n=1 Tax=Candidatus Chlorohelix allophototropha TaxID=3003348 RepID=A0A8T7LTR4_9CHLR|nr:CAP domain-containing protein [Chloroflexota bacterium]WJW67301.1 CAP domain-containing protein [Chloroflexota bacterium L227-S17]